MIINYNDTINFALYGNREYMKNILNIIKKYKKNNITNLVINNKNLDYLNDNTLKKYLIIKINNNIFTLNENEKILFIYNNLINIIIFRTDKTIYWDEWLNNIIKYYGDNNIHIMYNFNQNQELINIPKKIKIIENNIYNKGNYLVYYYILKNNLKGN